jgi:hypothetical protein
MDVDGFSCNPSPSVKDLTGAWWHGDCVWEHANTKSFGLAGFCAKSGDFRVTLVLSRNSMKYRRLRTCRICLFSPLLLDLPEILVSGLFEVLLFPDLPLPDSTLSLRRITSS